MNVSLIKEPELQFGAGKHISIRHGLLNYSPYDFDNDDNILKIRVGIVGSPQEVNLLQDWFEKCSSGIEAKESKYANMYIRFPGYGNESPLPAKIACLDKSNVIISNRELSKIYEEEKYNVLVKRASDLFFEKLSHISETKQIDVLICAPPQDLKDKLLLLKEELLTKEKALDFHDHLKARGLTLNHPIQFVWPATYLGKKYSHGPKSFQDEATRIWNFYTALYYKARGIPWRLINTKSEYTVCYVGVGFFHSLDNKSIQTTVAQLFNERGEGVITRGGPAERKDDKQLHINKKTAYKLLSDSLQKYRTEHKTNPARIVIHKSSIFDDEEASGFLEAAKDNSIELVDLLHITRSFTRVFRIGKKAPLRGTFLHLDNNNNVLYTFGSINFFKTYPGLYVPLPLKFSIHTSDQPPEFLANEILKLTKMNWNNTQMYDSTPLTIDAAKRVGALLKYIDKNENVSSSYRFYI
jgi:hypothetical protein